MKELRVTNMAKFYMLLMLNEKPAAGYDIIKSLSERLEQKISPGQVYPFLAKLQDSGYVRTGIPGAREKKTYALTPEGKAFVKRMLSHFGELVDFAVEPRLTVCAHCGCKVFEGGHREKIKGKDVVFCCVHCAKAFVG